jgi:hypothetical protein
MSCKQDINIDQECYFLTYLEGCEEKRLYPPMQLQENENFVVVYGTLTPNQFSISKDNFDVDLNGENYTDKDRFIAQMSLELNCINDKYSGGGGGGCDLTQVEDFLDTISTTLSGIETKVQTSYNGRRFDLGDSSGNPFPGFPFSIERILIIYAGAGSESVDVTPSAQQLTNTLEVANFLNENVEGLNFDKFKQLDTEIIFSSADKIAGDVLGIQLTLTGAISTLQYTSFVDVAEDNESELSKIRVLLEQIRNNGDAQKFTNWTDRVNKSKTISYYSAASPQNPSGNKNIESITFFESGNAVLKQVFEYDSDDDIVLQGALKP